MSIQIKLKNSVVQDSTPSTSDLPAVGEIALNANINSIGGFMRASDNSIVKIFGPGSLSTPTATTTVSGISELATNSETTTGTATNRVVTPAGLNAVTVAERTTSNTNYVAKAGSTLTGVLTMPNGSNSAPAINFGDSDSGIFGGTNTVSLAAGGTTRLTADTGISVVGALAVTGAITSTSDLTIADKIIHAGDTDTAIRFPAGNTVSVETGGSEALRVDSSQRLLIGTSSTRAVGGNTQKIFQIEGTDAQSGIAITRNSATNTASLISFGKSRGTSNGTSTIVQDDDQLGRINFSGADGTDVISEAAKIEAFVDGTPGANDMPGRLVFSTTADGADASTTRLTIDSAGTSTFAGNITTTGNLTISNTDPEILLQDTNNNDDFTIRNHNGVFTVRDATNGVDRLTIASDGTATFTQNLNANAGLDVTGAITGTAGLTIEGATVFNESGADVDFRIESSGTANMFVLDAGTNKIGLNRPTPLEMFEVGGNIYLTYNGSTANEGHALKFQAKTGGFNTNYGAAIHGLRVNDTSAYLRFDAGGTSEKMRLDTSGRLLLGTTTEGTVDSDDLTIATSGTTGITIRSGTSHYGTIHFSDATSGAAEYAGYIVYDHTNDKLDIGSNSTRFLSADSNSVVTLGKANFGGTSGVIAYGNTGGIRKDALLVLNATASVAGRGAGVSVGGTSSAIGSFYCNKAGNADSDGGNVFLESVGGLYFRTNGANDRVAIDSSGNLCVGTTTGDTPITVSRATTGNVLKGLSTNNNTRSRIELGGKDSSGNLVTLMMGGDGDFGGMVFTHTNHKLGFATNNAAPQMILDTDGDLLVGLTTALGTQTGSIQAAGPIIAKSHINAHTSNAIVMEYISNIGKIRAYGATSGSGVLAFNVGGGGDATDFEAMRIHSNGRVAIGTTNGSAQFMVARDIADSASNSFDNQTVILTGTITGNSTNNRTGLYFAPFNSSNQYSPSAITCTAGANYASTLKFFVNAAGNGTGHLTSYERMRIDGSGNTFINCTSDPVSNGAKFAVQGGGDGLTVATFDFNSNASASNVTIKHGRAGAVSGTRVGKMIRFQNLSGTEVGTIESGISSTAYNTSGSDRALKKNFESWNENVLDLFKGINPQKFNFIQEDDGAEKSKGFVAQDMVSSFPEAYTKADENSKYFFNPSGMVVYLMKAIQELEAEVAALKAA